MSIVGFMTLIWLINVGIIISGRLIEGSPVDIKYPLVGEATGVYTLLVLLPFLLRFFDRIPFRKDRWFFVLSLYLLVLVLYGISHTTLMIISRKVIFSLLGWKSYDPGVLTYRYLMEFLKQVGVFWFIFGVHALIGYIQRNQERRLQTARLEEQLTRARLQALKLQLDPHFLFNTLNMISSTMYEDVDRADRMISQLSDLLRLTLNTGESQQAALKDEIAILDCYLEIMKARFGDRLDIRMDLDPNTEKLLFPVLTLQPLVENSIKHGLEGDNQVTRINIRSETADAHLVVTVEDNGPGFSPVNDEAAETRTGLRTTRERLDRLYGKGYAFRMTNRSGSGLRTEITVPAEEA